MRHHLAVALEGIENRREPIADRNEQFNVTKGALYSQLIELEKAASVTTTLALIDRLITSFTLWADDECSRFQFPTLEARTCWGLLKEMAELKSHAEALATMKKIRDEYHAFVKAWRGAA